MSSRRAKALSDPILAPLGLFLRDFATFAGAKGLIASIFVLLGAIVEGLGLVLLIPFFSVVIDSRTGGWAQGMAERLFALFSTESRLARLTLLVAAFAVLMIARAATITVRDVMMAQLQLGFTQNIRSRITRRLAAARWDAVSHLCHSRVTHLMSADLRQLESACHIVLRDSVLIVMLASQTVLAFLLAPFLAALALSVVLLGGVTLLPMVRRARDVGRFVTNTNLALIHDMTQFLGALKLALSQNLQESFSRELEAMLCDLGARQIRYIRQQTLIRLAITTLAGIIGGVIIILGIVALDISASLLITLVLILSRMNAPAMQLQVDAQNLAHALPAYEKIRELERELADAETTTAAPSVFVPILSDSPIVFRKVSFLHSRKLSGPSSAGGVRDLDVTIEAGSIVGVTGASGAGKTTFADLLVGLYPPQSGEILIGDFALRGPLVTAWRSSISYVAQDPFLFHDTIRRNFLWASPKADEAALWEALQMAGAEEIVRNAAHGLDTVVGERGALLSGGERQRLCLARALLRRPRLLVLDEATNAIDVERERALCKRLLLVKPRPTIFMIAHRLESLSHCDRVLVLETGRIVSDGSSATSSSLGLADYRRARTYSA
jgi:ATP-binding cassette subfamily C protein